MSNTVLSFLFMILCMSMTTSLHAQTLSQETFFWSSVITDMQVGGDDLYFAEINYESSDRVNIKKLPDASIMSIDSMLVRDMAYNNESDSTILLVKDYNNQFYLYSGGVGKPSFKQQIFDYGVFHTLGYSNHKGEDIIFGYNNETLYWYSDDEVESLTLGEEIKGATVVDGVFFLCSFDGEYINIYSFQKDDSKKYKIHSVDMDINGEEMYFYTNGIRFVLWSQSGEMITKLFVFDNGALKHIDIEGVVHNVVFLNDRYYFNISYLTSNAPSWQINESGPVKSSYICNIFSADAGSMADDSKWSLSEK